MVKLTQAEIASMIHRKEERRRQMEEEQERRRVVACKKKKRDMKAVRQLVSKILHKGKDSAGESTVPRRKSLSSSSAVGASSANRQALSASSHNLSQVGGGRSQMMRALFGSGEQLQGLGNVGAIHQGWERP